MKDIKKFVALIIDPVYLLQLSQCIFYLEKLLFFVVHLYNSRDDLWNQLDPMVESVYRIEQNPYIPRFFVKSHVVF